MADVFKLDDGRVEFAVNGDPERTFYFYPSDAELLNKIYNMLPELEHELEEFKNKKSEAEMQLQDLLDFDAKIRTKLTLHTTKVVGFLLQRPLHCFKSFSFTRSPQA